MEAIGCDELRDASRRAVDLVVIDGLTPMEYAHSHLPVNDSSVSVAARFVELGYRNVRHYAGGKQEWRKTEFALEGRRA